MYFYLPLIISADTSFPLSTPPGEQDRQRALLKMFFAEVNPKSRAVLTKRRGEAQEDYLRWGGVTLRQGLVESVRYNGLRWIENLNIHALPHSTTYITIVECDQKYSLQTRMLPNQLEILLIHINHIFGTIDLTNLPHGLRSLSAYTNDICGPIDLTNLPESLIKINLYANKIDQRVVVYGNLPPKISEISLADQRNVTDGVKAVQPLRPHDKLTQKKVRAVFRRMRHYSAHSKV